MRAAAGALALEPIGSTPQTEAVEDCRPPVAGLADALDRLPSSWSTAWAASCVVVGLRAAAVDEYRLPVYASDEFLELADDDPRKFAAVVLAAERSEAAVLVEAVRRIRQVSYDISASAEWAAFSRWSQRERAARAARVAAGLEVAR